MSKCRCVWYNFFCNCDSKKVLYTKKKKSVENFCHDKTKIQTLSKIENDLYLKRTLGPGAYYYGQPRIRLCASSNLGYNTDRAGLLPLNSREIDTESKLRYSEDISLESYSRPLCNNIKDTRYTREIRPDNLVKQADRFEQPLYDPQAHIASYDHQFGKDTRNFHDDKFFSGYRKSI